MSTKEIGFEEAIETWLVDHGGYTSSSPQHFDRVLGLDTAELFAFIGETQVNDWNRLLERHGNDADAAQRSFVRRLAADLDTRGTVDVLRHGVDDLGVLIQLSFPRPAFGFTPELQARYAANRVTITRQLAYETGSNKTLDLALLVNGIPTATAELKNHLTGQTIEHAMAQYRHDRDAGNTTLAKRAVVHFAVDPDAAAMTTRLAGDDTRFLPFNQGSGGPGQRGGMGNPANPAGHRTAYLWERVWQRDAWLDLLHRFVDVRPQEPKKGKKRKATEPPVVIFPRFHQWDAVMKLVSDARDRGAGHNYLVQHSAGSGKSNTIAWLAHRLSNLHDRSDATSLDKVIVITDRIILDEQLQETIYAFEHARGVVVKIDQNSQQLADALVGEQAKIIITTLQKFPYLLDKIGDLKQRRYAVIIDEAHSSQSGEAAKDLRAALAGAGDDEGRLAAAEASDASDAAATGDAEDLLTASVAGRGRHDNLSFFAFTATPKAKTLEVFGSRQGDGDSARYAPFHLYSMRQAIEEKFILDVLRNYTTYATYWRIEQTSSTDRDLDKSRAKAAIARFVSLHPHHLAQKAEVIVEHFRTNTSHQIGGRAKAMVVTASRLHAVRYKQAIDAYVASKGYTDLAALVAFSGKVIDGGDELTESGMNGFPDSETAERFDGDDYQVLIVAEKFQTGFDQLLLHTMYVDKVLTGLSAVQTLSRLNRTHHDKEDTFVLDFRNDTDDIAKAFAPYYEQTLAIPTDVNVLWDTHRELMASPVIITTEIQPAVVALLTAKGQERDEGAHAEVNALLDPAVDRFVELDDEEQDAFRDLIGRFVSLYGFISQIVTFTDIALERDNIYARALAAKLPGRGGESIDISADVTLTHLRMTNLGQTAIALDHGDDLTAIFSGKGSQNDPDELPLSEIVAMLNERFGLELGEADQLFFDQQEVALLGDETLGDQARNNSFDNFRLVFDPKFLPSIIGRIDENDALFKRILDDNEFQGALKDFYAWRIYSQLRKAG